MNLSRHCVEQTIVTASFEKNMQKFWDRWTICWSSTIWRFGQRARKRRLTETYILSYISFSIRNIVYFNRNILEIITI